MPVLLPRHLLVRLNIVLLIFIVNKYVLRGYMCLCMFPNRIQSMDVKEGTRGAAGEGHSLVYPGAMQIPRCRSFEAFFPGPPTHTLYSLLVC